jgi:6-phosphogluconolactonase (cycloisomerase 2 family)
MYISFKKNNVAFIVLSTNGSYIYKEENDSHLSWKLDIKTEHKYLVQIHIRKLRSILTRMPENLLFKITESKLIISDLKSKKLAIFQIQKISK